MYARTLGAYGMLMWDEAEYASLARSLVRGEGYAIAGRPETLRPPVLPLAGAASIWLGGRADDRALGVATIGLALLALLIVYAAAARAYDAGTGLAAAGLLASTPWFWTATAHFLSELPLLAFFSAALFCWTFALVEAPPPGGGRRWPWPLLTGVCLALAVLTRYTALLLGPLLAIFTVLALAVATGARRRAIARDGVAALLVAVLVLAPWLLRQALAFGDPLVGFRRASAQLQVYMPGVSMPWSYYLTGLPAMLSLATVGLLGAGAAWAVRSGDRVAVHCLIVVLFVLTWFSGYRYKEPRLVSAMLPAAALLAAVGLTRGLTGGRPLPTAAAVAAIAVVAAFSAPEASRTFTQVRTLGYPSFLEAMAFVRAHSPPTALVVGPNAPQIFWYADRPVVDFPDQAALPAVLARADWVVITDFERGQRPYAHELAARLPAAAFADGSAARFTGRGFTTVVVRAERLVDPVDPALPANSHR